MSVGYLELLKHGLKNVHHKSCRKQDEFDTNIENDRNRKLSPASTKDISLNEKNPLILRPLECPRVALPHLSPRCLSKDVLAKRSTTNVCVATRNKAHYLQSSYSQVTKPEGKARGQILGDHGTNIFLVFETALLGGESIFFSNEEV